jgi:leader peptidase (prepilin peptidase)/N-methyltransferase
MPASPVTPILLTIGGGMVAASILLLPWPLALVGSALGLTMTAIAVVDAHHFLIPDRLSLPAIPAGLLATGSLIDPGTPSLMTPTALLGAAAGAASLWALRAVYLRWRGIEGLGLGDVKLAAAGGAWVGIDLLAALLLVSAVSALAIALVLAVVRRAPLETRTRMPFGAFMAPSIWLTWILSVTGHIG